MSRDTFRVIKDVYSFLDDEIGTEKGKGARVF